MKSPFRTSRSPAIGLHLSPRYATLVQVTGSAKHVELLSCAQGSMPIRGDETDEQYDELVVATLRLMVSDHGFRGHRVVSCVPANDLHLQSVRLPQLPPEELEKVVRWEAEERLPFKAQDAELRYLLSGQIRQDVTVKQEVVLMACPQVILQRQLRVLESAGLTPAAIDIEPCAILRAFRHGRKDNERIAYLHLGDNLTTVMIADGDSILFLKYVGSGGRDLDQAVAKHLDLELSEAMRIRSRVTNSQTLDSQSDVHRMVIEAIRPQLESLASELELCFRYFMVSFRGQQAAKLVVTGCEASPWLAEYLGHSLSCPVELGNPFAALAQLPQHSSAAEHPGRWAAALGLTLRSLEVI